MKTMPGTIRPRSNLLQKALANACTSCADDHEASVGLSKGGKDIYVVHSIGDDAATMETMHLPVLPGMHDFEYAWIIRNWILKRHVRT